MSGTETIFYVLTGLALAISCAAFILSSRFPYCVSRPTRNTVLFAKGMAATALLMLVASLALRGVVAGRWPLGSSFEFTLAFAASIILLYLLLQKVGQMPVIGAVATLLALMLVLHAFFAQPESVRALRLSPVLRGLWFSLHTMLTAIAYGALALAGGVAASGLIIPNLPVMAFVDQAIAIGYIALSLGMIAGGIWGEQAWGEHWSWSVKETWTLIIWLVCTFYYHVRHRRSWHGRRAMSIAVLALITVLVNLFFTPTLLHWTRLQRLRIY